MNYGIEWGELAARCAVHPKLPQALPGKHNR
jgi:hypothetical protein